MGLDYALFMLWLIQFAGVFALFLWAIGWRSKWEVIGVTLGAAIASVPYFMGYPGAARFDLVILCVMIFWIALIIVCLLLKRWILFSSILAISAFPVFYYFGGHHLISRENTPLLSILAESYGVALLFLAPLICAFALMEILNGVVAYRRSA